MVGSGKFRACPWGHGALNADQSFAIFRRSFLAYVGDGVEVWPIVPPPGPDRHDYGFDRGDIIVVRIHPDAWQLYWFDVVSVYLEPPPLDIARRGRTNRPETADNHPFFHAEDLPKY